MKYTILGFSQKKLIEYKLDLTDALILRYFVDFKDSGDMTVEIVNNKPFYWVKYNKLMKEIPIINIRSKDVLRRRLKKLEDSKVLNHYHKKKLGSYSYYGIGENYKYLIRKYEGTTQKSEEVLLKSRKVATQKSEGCYSKVGRGATQKSEQNINLLKDSSTKDSSIKDNIYKTIIDYLNSGANTKYKSTTKKTQSLIKARMNEGFSLEDFKTVVDKKCADWINTDFEKYLRPETLFGNKFESYLNQKPNNGPHGGGYNINVKKEGEIIAADKRNYCEGLEEQGIGI